MRRILTWFVGFLGLMAPLSARAADPPPPPFEFKDGDRVVLLGDTLIERDQKYGYLETILTIRNPDKNITFRNLGWSGDTVRGTARAFFGTEADGFRHLKEHVLALKPTVIIVGYGMADSFDGEAGLPRFESSLNVLIDVLAETKARIVLLSPIAHADMERPMPDPASHNATLKRYSAVIAKCRPTRTARFVDVFKEWEGVNYLLAKVVTDDGIHLTNEGYWILGVTIAKELQCLPQTWSAKFHNNGRLEAATGTSITLDKTKSTGIHFQALDSTLPVPPMELESSRFRHMGLSLIEPRLLTSGEISDGFYQLEIDRTKVSSLRWNIDINNLGRAVPQVASERTLGLDASTWAKGVEIHRGPEYDQVERLRRVINEKNLLYFHRWRPQNETYLFGFRKHEQGNNAREIPLFDPLVELKELEIARLRKPVPHTYDLVRESEVAK